MWSDCAENVYCEFVSDENNPNVHLHKQVESTVIAQVIGKGAIYSDGTREYWFDPVIQIMTIDRNTQINKQELDDDQFLSLILAHEVAHTLGMGDVYNYKFYEDAPHCYASGSSSNTNDCIMESFGCLKAMTFYYDILYNGKSAFCANCTSRLQSEMASDLYAN